MTVELHPEPEVVFEPGRAYRVGWRFGTERGRETSLEKVDLERGDEGINPGASCPQLISRGKNLPYRGSSYKNDPLPQ
jgi:hypothetical protein